MSPVRTQALAWVVALTLCASPGAMIAQQMRDQTPARSLSGTATVSGLVVTEEANSHPVRRAAVTLSVVADARLQRVVASDDDGRFTFTDVPAGEVTIRAAKPPFVATVYGAKRPGGTAGVPIAIAEGQQVTGLTLRLAPEAVITGTVFDEMGRPAASVPMRLLTVVTSVAGARSLATVNLPLTSAATDDRGTYRFFGLAPGNYVVAAQPRIGGNALFNLTNRGAGNPELRQPTSAEVQWAERQVRGSRAAGPEAPMPVAGPPVTYSAVFSPGEVNEEDAAVLTLAVGQQRTGVDIRLRLVATARVDGSVRNPDGSPAAGAQLTLLRKSAMSDDPGLLAQLVSLGVAAPASTARAASDGTFSLKNVQPGQYALMARTSNVNAERSGAAPVAPVSPGPAGLPGPPMWAVTDVRADGADVDGITLTLSPGLTLAGRFAFDSRTQQAPPPGIQVSLAAVGVGGSGASIGTAMTLRGNTSFSLTGLIPGTYRLSVLLSAWALKSAMLNGRDVADVPFEVKAGDDLAGLVLTVTDSAADVSGVVYDAAGHPTSDLSILLFATDRAFWSQTSRRIRPPVRASTAGRFALTNLPAGDYYLAAVSDVEPNAWFNPGFLDEIIPTAIKISVAEGEHKTQDVRVAGGAVSSR
jgi:hypothetical protein